MEESKESNAGMTTVLVDMTLLPYRNPVWANAESTSLRLEVQWPPSEEWTPYATASFDPEPAGAAFFARVVAESGENIGAYVEPPPAPYTFQISTLWSRLTDDEAETFDGAMATASPLRLRKQFNLATSMVSDSELFTFTKGVLTTSLTAQRAAVILAE